MRSELKIILQGGSLNEKKIVLHLEVVHWCSHGACEVVTMSHVTSVTHETM